MYTKVLISNGEQFNAAFSHPKLPPEFQEKVKAYLSQYEGTEMYVSLLVSEVWRATIKAMAGWNRGYLIDQIEALCNFRTQLPVSLVDGEIDNVAKGEFQLRFVQQLRTW